MSAAMRHGAPRQPKRTPGLRALERETNPRAAADHVVESLSYDNGAAISLQTANGAFPLYLQQMAVATSPNTFAGSFGYDDAFDSGAGFADAFYVEPFEDPAPAIPASPQPVVDAPATGAQPAPPSAVAPRPGTPHSDSPAAPVATLPAVIAAPTAPVSAPVSDDDFEDDIRQILEIAAQQPQRPEPPQPILKKPEAEEAAPATPEAEKSQQASASDRHAIFDMGHATTFDLGVVDLNRRFNEIEHALDVEEHVGQQKALATSFSDAGVLDDTDLIDDLSAVSSLLEEKLKEEQANAPRAAEPAPAPGNVAAPPAVAPGPANEAAPATPSVPPTSAAPAAPAAPTEPSVTAPPAAITPEAAPPAAAQPATSPPTATPGTSSFDVTHTVPVAQATEAVSAQAAGAAMLVAWRDQSTLDMQALAAGSGSWAAYAPGLKASGPEFFDTWGLKELVPEMLTLERLHTILKAHGPLWLQNPAVESAIRLVVGLSGDGSAGGTSITLINPSADAQTAQQTANINSLISQLGAGPVRIAHLIG